MKNNNTKLQLQSGVGLIEVMVAIILLAMGLLGAVALQFATAKEQRSSQFVARAALLGNEMAERMRGNREGIKAGLYNMQNSGNYTYSAVKQAIANNPALPAPCAPLPNCFTPALAEQQDLAQWWQASSAALPQVAAIVLLAQGPNSPSGARDIVLAWVEPVVDKDINGNPLLLEKDTNYTGCPPVIDAPNGVRCYQVRFVL